MQIQAIVYECIHGMNLLFNILKVSYKNKKMHIFKLTPL